MTTCQFRAKFGKLCMVRERGTLLNISWLKKSKKVLKKNATTIKYFKDEYQ